jgi:hypothetical protein
MPYVYSTLTADQAYTIYKDGGADLKIAQRICIIKGGAGVAGKNLITPRGTATLVSAQELEALEACDAFKRHKARGYLRVDEKEVDADKAVSGLNDGDKSAPLTDKDFEQDKKPSAGKNKPKSRG